MGKSRLKLTGDDGDAGADVDDQVRVRIGKVIVFFGKISSVVEWIFVEKAFFGGINIVNVMNAVDQAVQFVEFDEFHLEEIVEIRLELVSAAAWRRGIKRQKPVITPENACGGKYHARLTT